MSDADDIAGKLRLLRQAVERQAGELAEARHAIALLEDRNAIERLQYAYGYFIDDRMFREMADLFCDEGSWIEIASGRYCGKDRIRRFLFEVLGDGRWGLLRDEEARCSRAPPNPAAEQRKNFQSRILRAP